MKASIKSMADAWLAAARSGEWEDVEAFAELLLQECKRSVPPLGGIMNGHEREVIQEAGLMLLGAFLMRNERLHAATHAEDLDEIDRHLRASIERCLNFSIKRIARTRAVELSRRADGFDESVFGSVSHPRERLDNDLSPAERCALALGALQLGLNKRFLTERAAEIAKLTLEEGLNGREIARRLGISPSAVSQQLRRVSSQLSILQNAVEIALP